MEAAAAQDLIPRLMTSEPRLESARASQCQILQSLRTYSSLFDKVEITRSQKIGILVHQCVYSNVVLAGKTKYRPQEAPAALCLDRMSPVGIGTDYLHAHAFIIFFGTQC